MDFGAARRADCLSLLLGKEGRIGDAEGGGAMGGNWLVRGDNLFAMKALMPHFGGQVKCVFIDPPYNTGKDFEHYDDNRKHEQWLRFMMPRLELLHDLLAEDGSIWVTIDDDEGHYLKVLMDEIFGRKSFVANVIWQKKYSPQNDAKWLSDSHDHILVYAKDKDLWRPNLLPRTAEAEDRYKNHDNDPRGAWMSDNMSVKTYAPEYDYPITTPNGRVVNPPAGYCWRFPQNKLAEMIADNRIWFGAHGQNVPRIKRFLSEVKKGVTTMTIWPYSEVGHNQEAKQEARKFNSEEVFSTPKPERLIQRILRLATKPGDLVLDSFLGSGTTAAVAHKMGRRWIGIESGEHAETHCIPRLRKVIDGEEGGISKSENWEGGGGFYFMTLGTPIFDESGNVHPELDYATLAAHVWFWETKTPMPSVRNKSPFLGEAHGVGYALLYNGILKDKTANGGNALNNQTLRLIRAAAPTGFDGKMVVYGIRSCLQAKRLESENVEFRQIPFELKLRNDDV